MSLEDKVIIKPVLVSYEKAFWRQLPSEEELEKAKKGYWEELKHLMGDDVKVEEPFIISKISDFRNLLKELTLDIDALFVMRIYGGDHRRIAKLGFFGFPTIFYENPILYKDVIAYINQFGGNAFFISNKEELERFVRSLKAYRNIKRSIAIYFSSTGLPSFTIITGGWDIEKIRRKFGTEFVYVTIDRLFNDYEKSFGNDVDNIVDKLISDAKEVKVNSEQLKKAVKLYLAMEKIRDRYEANMLSITCPEEIFYNKGITPCLALVLFKDRGIPSSCEGDLSALLAMSFLMFTSNKSAFMGNLWSIDAEKGIFRITHDVFPLKFYGIHKESKGYCLYDFHDKGYGATTYVEVPKGEIVTLARMHFTFDKILAFRGQVLKTYQGIACRETLNIKVENGMLLDKYLTEYGHHFSMIPGDYIKEIEYLAQLFKIKLETL